MSQRLSETLSKRASRQAIAALSSSISAPTFGRAVFRQLPLFWRGTGIFLHNGRNPGLVFNLATGVFSNPTCIRSNCGQTLNAVVNGVRLPVRFLMNALLAHPIPSLIHAFPAKNSLVTLGSHRCLRIPAKPLSRDPEVTGVAQLQLSIFWRQFNPAFQSCWLLAR
jgi:hypothetical protein